MLLLQCWNLKNRNKIKQLPEYTEWRNAVSSFIQRSLIQIKSFDYSEGRFTNNFSKQYPVYIQTYWLT